MANIDWDMDTEDMDLAETVGMKVVAVDDDPIYLHTMTQMLQRSGYQVTAKASPAEALREVEENPDGVDFIMTVARTRGPGIDGIDLIQRIGKSYAIVLVSSGDEPVETMARGLRGGACYLMTKPLSENKIFIIWQHVLRWRRACAAAGNGNPLGSSDVVQPDDTSRKRGPVVNDSDQGGSHGGLHLGTTKKTKVVSAANQLQQTEDDTPNNIGEFMELDGLNVPSDQVRSHLQKYKSDYPTGPLSTMPSSSPSHSNSSSKNYPVSQHSEGSLKFHMRSEGPTDINQTSWLSGGASPIDFGVLGNGDHTTILGGAADYGIDDINGYGHYYDDTPNNIGEFMELDGLNVPSDQVRSHLQKYRSDYPTGPLSTMPSSSPSHSNSSSKNYPASQHSEGSLKFHMRSEGPTDINQTSWLSGGTSPVDFGVLGNGDHTTILGGAADYGIGDINGYGHYYGNDNTKSYGYCYGNADDNNYDNGNGGLGGVHTSGSMVSASLPSNLAQPVQHGMNGDRVAGQTIAVHQPSNLDTDFVYWDNYVLETAGTSGGGGVVTNGAIDGPTMDEIENFMNP